jgi:hypothetical protein
VRGLYRAFPPPDPPVYVRPQLKTFHGICSFTTTTFGAHRGADQGAGRSTSGRDLLHLLGGSTSVLPPSIAGLLQLPGLTSTRPGRHTAVPDLHRHLRAGTRLHRAGIFYVPAGTFYVLAGIFYVPAGIYGSRVDFGIPRAGKYLPQPEYVFSWPVFAFLGRHLPIPTSPGRHSRFLGQTGQSRLGRGPPIPAGLRSSNPGWAAALLRCPGWAGTSYPGWTGSSLFPAGSARGWIPGWAGRSNSGCGASPSPRLGRHASSRLGRRSPIMSGPSLGSPAWADSGSRGPSSSGLISLVGSGSGRCCWPRSQAWPLIGS